MIKDYAIRMKRSNYEVRPGNHYSHITHSFSALSALSALAYDTLRREAWRRTLAHVCMRVAFYSTNSSQFESYM